MVQSSPRSPGKIEKWLSSPPLKSTEKSSLSTNGVSLRRFNPNLDIGFHRSQENSNDNSNTCVTNSPSPFKTPPSLSYCHDKVSNVFSDQEFFFTCLKNILLIVYEI